ncbi:flagellar motor switch protein FliM [bacterium]|nr:flagellar motor switch protein FliM [bacterium]MBU1599949.1 flagellar motor switch protein FliM [bacterium]MBU2461947.1 flagellar motor switch protein FliM [bacterium]
MQEEKEIRDYDFRNPERLTRDNLLSLKMIYERFGQGIAGYLSGQLRIETKVEIEEPRQVLYSDFIAENPFPTILALVNHPPLPAASLIWFQPALVFYLLERFFGGKGEEAGINRAITDIEQQVVSGIAREFLKHLKRAWERLSEIDFSLKGVVINPLSAQIVAAEELVIKTEMKIIMGDKEGKLACYLPFTSIEPLLTKLTTKPQTQEKEKGESKGMERGMNLVPLSVTAELGRVRVTMKDILNFAQGDVLRLSGKVADGVVINVANKPKFIGIPGISGGNIALQIKKVL